MKRREFLATSAAAAVAVTCPKQIFALDPDNMYRKEIGIQLYTLRNEIKKDVKGTIQAVADAGYKQVEMYGFPNSEAMIEAAKESGLAINSTRFEWDSVVNPDDKGVAPFAEILDQAKEAGLSHLVIPYLADKNRKNLDAAACFCWPRLECESDCRRNWERGFLDAASHLCWAWIICCFRDAHCL